MGLNQKPSRVDTLLLGLARLLDHYSEACSNEPTLEGIHILIDACLDPGISIGEIVTKHPTYNQSFVSRTVKKLSLQGLLDVTQGAYGNRTFLTLTTKARTTLLKMLAEVA